MTTGTITPVADGTCEAAAAPFRTFP
jgi:hypothetical protein